VALRNALPFAWLNRLGVVPYRVGATHGAAGITRLLRGLDFEVAEVTAVLHCPRALAVPLCRLVERRASKATRAGLLRLLMAMERLSGWPTRQLTGHFVAARAIKRGAGR